MVYDLQGDFPNLPKRSNHNQGNLQTDKDQQSNSTAASQVTTDTLTQLQEEMKAECMAMIQTEVKTQIQNKMTVMQSEMANLTTKIAARQEGITASIDAAI
jgi:hypothetical protein